MVATLRHLVKYLLAVCIVGFLIISFVSTLQDAYSYTSALARPLLEISLITVLVDPRFWVVAVLVGGFVVSYGKHAHGSLVSFTVWCIKTADSVLGYRWFSEPVIKGIVSTDSVAWKFEYLTGGEVSPVTQCCPQCGTELEEKILPTDAVYGSDAGFKPNQNWQDTEAETWANLHGAPKSESTNEQLALACTLCRFTSPSSKSDEVDRGPTQKVFERHIERMKSGNPRKDPFVEYKEIAAEQGRITVGDPSPEGVWDAYVSTRDDPELIPFDPTINQ